MTIDAPDVAKKDGVERRTLIKAAAWAAPVVAVAAASPAFAASPGNPDPVPSTTTNTAFTAINVEDVETGGTRTGLLLNEYPEDGWAYYTVRKDGVLAQNGIYYVDASLTFTVSWTSDQSLTLTADDLRGWVLQSSGTNSATYTYAGRVLNGLPYQVALPKLTLSVIGGGALTAGGRVDASVSGPNIPAKGVFANW